MKTAYLVLAHNNPGVLKKAVGRLSSERAKIFIHIDRKSRLADFSGVQAHNVSFLKNRVPVYWAEFSGVEATLRLMQAALQDNFKAEYLFLISGTDYPLRSSAYIENLLERNRGAEFISLVKVPSPGKPLSRINTVRFPSHKPVRRFAARALAKLGMARRDYRKHLVGLDAYAGNTWWALSRESCHYILDFVEQNPKFVAYFESVFAPDEAFFHTILGNSPFKPRVRRNLLYEDWSTQGAHPVPMAKQHVTFFASRDAVRIGDVYGEGEAVFARKFADSRLELLDKIDQMIETKESSLPEPRTTQPVLGRAR
jgi:hypothetical protein